MLFTCIFRYVDLSQNSFVFYRKTSLQKTVLEKQNPNQNYARPVRILASLISDRLWGIGDNTSIELGFQVSKNMCRILLHYNNHTNKYVESLLNNSSFHVLELSHCVIERHIRVSMNILYVP